MRMIDKLNRSLFLKPIGGSLKVKIEGQIDLVAKVSFDTEQDSRSGKTAVGNIKAA